ncbi:DUF4352 domain-containing protein [Rathayibacter sp. KR2-224]|uniref:DUF4352 domain-containing protein n=1 Tax=Rathayibacter sp. KR2-224 TaxID=3400913 RepID=UPI003BFD0DF2
MSDNPVPPPPGFYDDGTGQQRYWDGQRWADTPTTAPVAAAAVASVEPTYGTQSAQQAGEYSSGQVPANGTGQTTTLPPSTPAKQVNVLGIVALCVAVIGFIFACIPGALIVGWVALPIAFVLSIVALFLKGKGKALALTGLIISIVGTIVGFVVFFAVVAGALGGTDSSVAEPKSSGAASSSSKADAGSGKVGTRNNPAPIGSQITGGDYSVTVNSVNLNGADAVTQANQFNDQPEAGSTYALINLTVTYSGKDSGDTSLVGVSYVTSKGNVINTFDHLVVPPDPSFSGQELYAGATVTGNIVIQVPVGDDGLLRIRPGVLSDEIFVKTH